ncbi:MAG: peptidase S41 [Flavobacterium sp.]|uniref:S41 family peptidase n=1 Tax=unclassified Flavobacterium TaxID=196869 RepID=UPI000C4B222F|nr:MULTISPECIES: S41 family peptidase [unclassified Flavobacterium]MBF01896.1 peptidase S41 [Flavobacterium sp.]MCO6161485.1 S41 family peptidase [Flavobacterium sp. NRK F7]
MKTNKIYFPIIIAMAVAIGLLLGNYLNSFQDSDFLSKNTRKNKLNKLIDFIDREYVDDINTDSIVDLTVNGILENLDPHSVYISKKDLKSVTENMKGDFVGIGVNFYVYKDTVAVIKPIHNGPSERAGIKAGDRILFADNYQLFDKKIQNDSLFSKLKGEKGSTVLITVFRKTTNEKLKIKVKRDVIPIKSVDIALKVNAEIGYIKINRFAETTYDEFHKALLSLKRQGIQDLVIDLRDNGGGYLEMAVAIADELLKDKELIVKTKNKKGSEDETFATSKGDFEKGKVYVLINENSASASEILAGAIQDNDRGTIVGRRSFGKGLVQREMPLGDGSAVRLTIARYFTPSGRSIQKPYDDKADGYFNEFEKRFQSGELYEADSIKVADSLKFKTKRGRIVYGGGGITPDVFVPFEAKHGEEATLMIMQSGVVSYFVFEQLDKKRTFFNTLDFKKLKAEVIEKDDYLEAFKQYVSDSGIILNFSDKEKIKKYLYAEFVKQLFDDNSYYEILLSEDAMIKKVLELN